MKGFIGIIGENKDYNTKLLDRKNSYIYNEFNSDDIKIERNTTDKFLNDKIFADSDDYFIMIEGVVLNDKELISNYNKQSLEETIVHIYI